MGAAAYNRPFAFLISSLLFLSFFIWQIQFIHIDTTTEGFMKKDDPSLIEFMAFKEEFGRDEQYVLSIEHPDTFSETFLQQLIDLHQMLEQEVPYTDEVNSLHDVRDIYGDDDELIVEDFLEYVPETSEALLAKKQKALSKSLYRNTYITEDGKVTNIFVRPKVYYATQDEQGNETYQLIGDVQLSEMYQVIRRCISQFPDIANNVHLAGTPSITEELNRYLVGDMLKFIALALLVISGVLYFLFRRILMVILPLLVMMTALVSTIGLMSLTNQPIQMPTVILPSFILAVGVGDSIHLLSIFLRQLQFGHHKKNSHHERISPHWLTDVFYQYDYRRKLVLFW